MSHSGELWYDVATLVDAGVLAGTVSLVHMWVNVHATPGGTTTTNDCPQWQGWFLAILLVPCVASTIHFFWRSWNQATHAALLHRGEEGIPLVSKEKKEAAPRPPVLRPWQYRLFEMVVALPVIVCGATMQVVAKPEFWGVSAFMTGCTLFDSPPSLLLWLTGEIASFGYGARLILLIWSELYRVSWVAAVLSLFMLLLVAGGMGVAAHLAGTNFLADLMQTMVNNAVESALESS